MLATARACDICLAPVDVHWPLSLTSGRDSSPTGEHVSVDFCSTPCLRAYVADLPESVSSAQEG